jgi:GT2 family glycosyltransferase
LLRSKNLRVKTLPETISPQLNLKSSGYLRKKIESLLRKSAKQFKHGSTVRKLGGKFARFLPISARKVIFSAVVPDQSFGEDETTSNMDIGFGLPTSDAPLISIIIPVFNEWWMTDRCLRAIQRSTNLAPFEIIVIDDASSDQTQECLGNIRGISVIRNFTNQGYLLSTNLGASHASKNSKYIHLLNNDTEPIGNWLDELLGVFKSREDVAIVGSTLFFPHGQLQESGSQVFRDGQATNIGSGNPSMIDMYAFVREVDYCSAAAILIDKEFWDKVGGFDSRYAPAYYEDPDLAMTAWSAGLKVYVSPTSWVVHYLGVSHGTSLDQGIRRFLAINREKFVEKWSEELAEHWEDTGVPRIEFSRKSKGIIVLCDAELPHLDRNSGSQRTVRIAQRLMAMGYHVVLGARKRSSSYIQLEKLREIGIEVQEDNEALFASLRLRSERIRYFWIIRGEIYEHYKETLSGINQAVPIICDLLDLEFYDEAKTTISQLHLKISHECDATVLVSPAESKILENASGIEIDNVWLDYQIHESDYLASARNGILFVGGFRHTPNIEGIYWFGQNVMPELKRLNYTEAVRVVGSGLSLEQKDELEKMGLTILGFQADLEIFYESAKLAIVPLIRGAGMKGKLAESLSFGVPTVTTSVGAEGFSALTNGEFPFVVSDNPLDFAQQIMRFISDSSLAKKQSLLSFDYAKTHFNTEAFDQKIEKILAKASKTNS